MTDKERINELFDQAYKAFCDRMVYDCKAGKAPKKELAHKLDKLSEAWEDMLDDLFNA